MEGRKKGAISVNDVIKLFSEDGLLITVEEAEATLEFLRTLAKNVVNDYLMEVVSK